MSAGRPVEVEEDVATGPRWRIERPGRFGGLGVRALWQARELLGFFAWRDLKVRYSQTVLGAAWAVLQPALMMAVFTFLFSRLGRMPSEGVPYPLFAYTGLVAWQLFASAFTESSNSVVTNARLLTKVAFPRMVFPFSAVATSLVDAAIASLLLFPMMAWYGVAPALTVLLLPALLVVAAVAALAVGLWLAALNVRYRDVRYAIPFFLQPLLFLTPVAYPATLVPERWRVMYALNPMVGIVETVRWAVLGTPAPQPAVLLTSAAVTLALLLAGMRYFRQAERAFADLA